MKVVILAGGLGSRLSEETSTKPKPMVEIGGYPILWHIMKIYSAHGINDFILCLGYKSYLVKEYFANYFLHNTDVTIDMKKNTHEYHKTNSEPWRITLVDTGIKSMTGGRLKRVAEYLDDNEPFCLTYGDGVSDVDITASIKFHQKEGCKVTMTAVAPPGRFGAAIVNGTRVTNFTEKLEGDGGLINGGFFICEPSVLDLIENDDVVFEKEPLRTLATAGELGAFTHHGFWQPMDTLRDKNELEAFWASEQAPWKIW